MLLSWDVADLCGRDSGLDSCLPWSTHTSARALIVLPSRSDATSNSNTSDNAVATGFRRMLATTRPEHGESSARVLPRQQPKPHCVPNRRAPPFKSISSGAHQRPLTPLAAFRALNAHFHPSAIEPAVCCVPNNPHRADESLCPSSPSRSRIHPHTRTRPFPTGPLP